MKNENHLNEFGSMYSFHDANIDYLKITKENIVFISDFLNMNDDTQYTFELNFTDCKSIKIDYEIPEDWNDISATILEYNISDNFLKLFAEVTNHKLNELSYFGLEFYYDRFNYKQL